MSDYQEGSMDISEHRRTWAGFVKLTQISVVAVVAVLVLMALFLV
jgi:Bacterial aa3 type cytochrome c oxidase subunit IV.